MSHSQTMFANSINHITHHTMNSKLIGVCKSFCYLIQRTKMGLGSLFHYRINFNSDKTDNRANKKKHNVVGLIYPNKE